MTNVDPGLWCEVDAVVPPGRAALFLDRDGEPEAAQPQLSARSRLLALAAFGRYFGGGIGKMVVRMTCGRHADY
jgi:hypothetical protein